MLLTYMTISISKILNVQGSSDGTAYKNCTESGGADFKLQI
jgi:hypothetical protein